MRKIHKFGKYGDKGRPKNHSPPKDYRCECGFCGEKNVLYWEHICEHLKKEGTSKSLSKKIKKQEMI